MTLIERTFREKIVLVGVVTPPSTEEDVEAHLDELGVSGLLVLGGDGSLSGAMQLSELGVNIIGVPKTIDNDLNSTDRTFGFSSAVQVAVEAIDKVHTTATSHERKVRNRSRRRLAGARPVNK